MAGIELQLSEYLPWFITLPSLDFVDSRIFGTLTSSPKYSDSRFLNNQYLVDSRLF